MTKGPLLVPHTLLLELPQPMTCKRRPGQHALSPPSSIQAPRQWPQSSTSEDGRMQAQAAVAPLHRLLQLIHSHCCRSCHYPSCWSHCRQREQARQAPQCSAAALASTDAFPEPCSERIMGDGSCTPAAVLARLAPVAVATVVRTCSREQAKQVKRCRGFVRRCCSHKFAEHREIMWGT